MTAKSGSKPLQWAVWGVLFLVIATIFALFTRERLTTSKSNRLVYSVVRDFALTNQNGRVVTLADLKGKVWVADIVFTRCPGPCRRMTRDMARLQELWPKDSAVRFVTLTTDPEYDTAKVMKEFADEHKADHSTWHFLTGTKQQIVDLAIDGLKLTALDKEESKRESVNDLFIHSTIFVIVDKRGQVRGTVESDAPDALNNARVIVEELLHER